MAMAEVYVASSWRNERQPSVVKAIRNTGLSVYDFRNPAPGNNGFHWSEIDPNWQSWTAKQFRDALRHPVAQLGLGRDEAALRSALATVLVMPCGRSAHLELGTAIGLGQYTAILLSDGEPELMYGMANLVTDSLDEIIETMKSRLQNRDSMSTGSNVSIKTCTDVALVLTQEEARKIARSGANEWPNWPISFEAVCAQCKLSAEEVLLAVSKSLALAEVKIPRESRPGDPEGAECFSLMVHTQG